jgi:hypothetical protein
MTPEEELLLIVIAIAIASIAMGYNLRKFFDDWGRGGD